MSVQFPTQIIISENTIYADGFCKSTDSKPEKLNGLDLITGSSLFEVDTSDAYLYDEDSKTWIKQGNSSSDNAQEGD